ncbi:MAG: carbon storage regulator [Desulfuromonadales bacterium]|nr:carbon storage regulator [Desulfuromonadales bacterium]
MPLGIKGNQVKIGIEAPDHVEIWREELVLRRQQEGNGKCQK